MKFVFFGFGEWTKWTRVMKGLMGAILPRIVRLEPPLLQTKKL